MVAGAVRATDLANFTGVPMEIWLDGRLFGTVALYGYDGTSNYYQFSLGFLVAGIHTVEARFPRTRR